MFKQSTNILHTPHKQLNLNQKIKNRINHVNVNLQRLGKSLMFPIAVLPIAALMNRIGSLLMDPTVGVVKGSWVWWIGQFINAPGAAVFNNIAIIFAIGVAFGLAKDHRGESAICGGIAYLILSLMTTENMIPSLFYQHVNTFDGYAAVTDDPSKLIYHAFSKLLYIPVPFQNPSGAKGDLIYTGTYVLDTGVIGGITCGCVSAVLYNKYKDIQLPQSLAFFGGRRFVPMVVVLSAFCLSFLFAALWPWIQLALISIGQAISSGDAQAAGGAFVYGLVNRLLQPFGAHHIINTFLWFQLPVEGSLLPGVDPASIKNIIDLGNGKFIVFGDINAFAAGVQGAGIFQSGYFPVFFGGIPATGVAMIYCARKEKRREVATFIGGVALVSLLTGIDEPIVFIWIFLSPLLLLLHAILTATFAALVVGMGIRLGFGFSAGLIDYVISLPKSWSMSMQHTGILKVTSNPLWVLPISAVMGIIYFFVWSFFIKKLNIQTPGRNLNDNIKQQTDVTNTSFDTKNKETITLAADKKNKKVMLTAKYDQMAKTIVDVVGNKNFITVENCATRLRLIVNDNKTNINDQALKNAGVYQVIRVGNQGLQLVIGTDVEQVTERVQKILRIE